MKGKKFIIRVLAIIMIGGGILSAKEVVAEEFPKAPIVIKAEVKFPGGALVSYTVNEENGCIKDISDKYGRIDPEKQDPPGWLVENKKKIIYSGGFSKSQCQQGIGIVGIGSSPIEYYSPDVNGNNICVGAYDPCNREWYPRCKGPYKRCP